MNVVNKVPRGKVYGNLGGTLPNATYGASTEKVLRKKFASVLKELVS